jgi:hypothetical protein
MRQHQSRNKPKLFEGLRPKDLKDLVSNVFTIDQYKSKMGEDKDIVVIGFKVNDKFPATDLMEFIEKSYEYILDADMSQGEERDGDYRVFVELERNQKVGFQIKNMLEGIGHLCDCYDWKFKYYKDNEPREFTVEAINQHVPLTPELYEVKALSNKNKKVSEFFNQGSIDDVILDDHNNLKFIKPYSESMQCKLIAMGMYEELKDQVPGAIQLDETSRTQMIYLEKYLGNYEIHKINNQFLIRNGDKAVILQKDSW